MKTVTTCLLAVGLASLATGATAHGFGQRYDLPLPLGLYLAGTAAAVVLSFVVVGAFLRHAPSETYPRLDLLTRRPARLIACGLVHVLRVVVLVLFVVTIAAGFWGNQNPYQNLAPTLVWIIFWVGLAVVSAGVGDVWALVNPWRTVFDALGAGRPLAHRAYPAALGVWPACLLLLAFSWIELVYPQPAVPVTIAWLAIGYSALTLAGMAMYGRDAWLRHGEVFSVFFGLFARFAPLKINSAGIWLRPFGAGLLAAEAPSPSMVAFVLLALSSVLFDGALATPQWNALEDRLSALVPAPLAIRTAGLLVFWAVFLGAYRLICSAMSRAAGGSLSGRELARRFAFTLVPIAIAYHLAHYLTFLLVQGQYIIPLLSDPFGLGWNLFGTAAYRVEIGIVGPRFAWYAAVAAIVIGHVAAVLLAHAKAMSAFPNRGAAVRGETPLTALMVVYTFVSLSILAEPITERRGAVEPVTRAPVAIPADAVLPEPGTGRLLAVGSGHTARQKLTYRAMASAFHDETRTGAADLLYALMFAYRWAANDPHVDAATAKLRADLLGLRVTGVDTASRSYRIGDFNVVRELIIIDVYLAAGSDDPEQGAVIAPPWTTVPWHLLVLMEEAASRGWAAFSQAEAARRGVPWLDLARSKELSWRLAGLVDVFARDGFRPETLHVLVSIEEARKRWAALAAFYRTHGHFLVTNGPYRLKSWSDDSAKVEVFRDLTYPLGVGSYDAYAVPRRGFVARMERDGERLHVTADVETVVKFARNYRIERVPLRSLQAETLRRAAPECRYTVTNSAGRVVMAGVARPSADATFTIEPSTLPAGRYTVRAQIIVNGNAMNTEIAQHALEIPAR